MTVFVDRSTTIMSVFTGKQRSSLRVFGQSGSCEDFHATLEIQTNPPCCWARLICESRVLGERPRLMRERNGKRVRIGRDLLYSKFARPNCRSTQAFEEEFFPIFSKNGPFFVHFWYFFCFVGSTVRSLAPICHRRKFNSFFFERFEFILKNKKPFSFESCLPSVVHFRKGSRRTWVEDKET